jgi:hypothetical protein
MRLALPICLAPGERVAAGRVRARAVDRPNDQFLEISSATRDTMESGATVHRMAMTL